MAGWLDNFGKEDNYNDYQTHTPEGFVGEETFNGPKFDNPAWGGQFQMGGSLPGATGMMYSRQGAPSNGKYAKKTMASAQNGKEMQYYQQGLDWQPKTISQNGTWLDKFQEEHPSVRSIQNDTMNRKIQEHKGRDKETTVTQKDNARIITHKEIKKLSGAQQNELSQRQSEEQANKDWVQGSMEEAYKSPLMSPGYFTPEGMAIGAMQGATKLGPDLYDSNYKEAALDALTILPEIGNVTKILKPSIENINNIHGYEPIDWDIFNIKKDPKFEEYMRRVSLEPSKFKEAHNVLSNFKERINTPEGIRRAKELGVNRNYLDNLKLLEDNTEYGYSNGQDIALHKDLPKDVVRTVTRHEIEHGVKNAIQDSEMEKASKWYKNLPFMNNSTEKIKALNTNTTPIDHILSNIELRKEPTIFDKLEKKSNILKKDIDVSDYREKLSNRQNAIDYFDRGSNGNEKSAFAGEVQQYMLDKDIIKHPYENITPQQVKHAHVEAAFDKDNPIRLFHIMKATDNNYNTIAKALNKMLTVTGAGVIGSEALDKKENGGIIKDDRGQWDHPGEITEISGDTMATHGYGNIPLYVVPDKGKPRLVQPNTGIQKFPGAKKFTEYPIAKNGLRQEQKGLQNLDQLTNWSNYNTKQKGGWLDNL